MQEDDTEDATDSKRSMPLVPNLPGRSHTFEVVFQPEATAPDAGLQVTDAALERLAHRSATGKLVA